MDIPVTAEDRVIYSCHKGYDHAIKFEPCLVVKETKALFIIKRWDEYGKKWGAERQVRKWRMERHEEHYFETKDAAVRYFAANYLSEKSESQHRVDNIEEAIAKAVAKERQWATDRLERSTERLNKFVASNASLIKEFGLESEVAA